MGLKFASARGIRLDLGEGAWVEVVEEISKGTFRRIMQSMPQKELRPGDGERQSLVLTQGEAVEYQCALFESLVVGWSADVPANIENYLKLDNESANAIDKALADHFAQMTPDQDEVGKPQSSPAKPRKG